MDGPRANEYTFFFLKKNTALHGSIAIPKILYPHPKWTLAQILHHMQFGCVFHLPQCSLGKMAYKQSFLWVVPCLDRINHRKLTRICLRKVEDVKVSKLVILVSILGATPTHIPLKYRCLMKIDDQIRYVYLMWAYVGTSKSTNIFGRWIGLRMAHNMPT